MPICTLHALFVCTSLYLEQTFMQAAKSRDYHLIKCTRCSSCKADALLTSSTVSSREMALSATVLVSTSVLGARARLSACFKCACSCACLSTSLTCTLRAELFTCLWHWCWAWSLQNLTCKVQTDTLAFMAGNNQGRHETSLLLQVNSRGKSEMSLIGLLGSSG